MEIYLIPNVLDAEAPQQLPVYLNGLLPQINNFLVENERTARRFLGSLKLGINIREQHFHLVDKKTKPSQIAQIFQRIPAGSKVGVISEAGVPCVADPGHLVVAHAHQQGWEVLPISGPSSILLALMGSGLGGQKFRFHGYLPIPPAEMAKAIRKMEGATHNGETQIFMETPYRNNKMFEAILNNCQPSTKLCIASNLTAPNQYLRTKAVKNWKLSDVDLHKQPTIFVLGQ